MRNLTQIPEDSCYSSRSQSSRGSLTSLTASADGPTSTKEEDVDDEPEARLNRLSDTG